MIKILLKARLQGLFATMFGRYNRKKGGRGRRVGANKIGIALLAVFVVASLFFSFGAQFYMMAEPLNDLGVAWLYFAVSGLMSLLFCVIGSVFITQSQLFACQDNDLLLSMPIKPSHILASRIISLLTLNYIYAGLIMLPALVSYVLACGANARQIIMALAATVLLPLVSMAIVCILGWVIALVSSRMRKSNLITNLLFAAGLAAYMAFAFQLQKYVHNLISNGVEIGAALQKAVPPVYYFGKAAAGGELINLLWLALVCIVPFALVYMLLSKFFITIATTNKGHAKIRYKERAMKAKGQTSALLRKEFDRFFGTPIYLLNCGMGAVMHLLIAGAVLWNGGEFLTAALGLPAGIDMSAFLPAIMCVCLAFCSMTVLTSAVSISLEGKNLWLLKASPVTARKALGTKLLFNLAVGGPTGLIAGLLIIFFIPMDILSKLIVVFLPQIALCFTAVLGLVCNLTFPRLDWNSEAEVIKRSASVMISMFSGMGIIMGGVVGYIFLHDRISVTLYMLLVMAALAVIAAALYGYIRTKGERLFSEL